MKKEIENQLKVCGDLKSQLEYLFYNYPKQFMSIIRNDGVFDLRKRIYNACAQLASDAYTDLTRVYWILNGLDDFPKCELCGKPVTGFNVKRIQTGYGKITACCAEHMNKLRYMHIAESNTEKYGAANPFQFRKDEITKRNIERYGTACPACNNEIRARIRERNLEKYGCAAYQSTEEFKNRRKTTVLEKYGVDCTLLTPESKEKTRLTDLRKYGREDHRSAPEVRKKIKDTLIERYGADYGEKIWGNRGNPGQNRRAYQFMLGSAIARPCFSEDEYLTARNDGVTDFEFECLECGRRFYSDWDNGKPRKKCPYCQFNGGISGIENELLKFVSSIYSGKIRTNDRSVIAPLELDEYIDGRKLAIELDGLYWHNDDVKPDYRYHLNKTELCEKAGVRLIHIFDCEWLNKRDIVKSRLKDILGVYDRTVFARKCEIREVDPKTSREFQEKNHIQGALGAGVHIGLYFENELISLMTFGKCRFDRKHEWELLRFCSSLGYHIPGAAGKLLKHFERTRRPKSLVSYADRRWSQGSLYGKLGFTLHHASNPDYWYFKQNTTLLESRVKYQKHRLKKLLDVFDENKTEVENMKANGYFRIFDCGNFVFEKTYF